MPSLQLAFKNLAPSDLAEVLPLFEPNEHEAGHVLMTEGDPHDSLLFLEHGRVELSIGGVPLTTVEAGSLLGEISLIAEGPRTVTAVATTEVVYHRLRRPAWDELRRRHHPLVWEIEKRTCKSLAARLHTLADEIATLGAKSQLVEILPGPLSVGAPLPSTPGRVAKMLAATPGFSYGDEAWLASMAADLEVRAWKQGEHLSTAAHAPLGFVLVAMGEIERFAAAEPTRGVRLAVWGPGAMAGLATLVDPRPIRGFVVATAHTTALVATTATFRRWLSADSDRGSAFRTAVIKDLANQVTNANATQSMLHLLGGR